MSVNVHAKNQDSVPRAHIRWFIVVCNSNSWGLYALTLKEDKVTRVLELLTTKGSPGGVGWGSQLGMS